MQYYYNSQTQQFLYWDSEKYTYMPAPTSTPQDSIPQDGQTAAAASTTMPTDQEADEQKKRPPTPEKKVKVAKKIVKVSRSGIMFVAVGLKLLLCSIFVYPIYYP